MPIFVERRWWGLLGLEDHVNERKWSKAKLDALQAAAEIFSASEIRARSENALYSVWEEENEKFTPLAAYGQHSKAYLSLTTTPGEPTLTTSALAVGHTLVIDDLSSTQYLSPRSAALLPFRSAMAPYRS